MSDSLIFTHYFSFSKTQFSFSWHRSTKKKPNRIIEGSIKLQIFFAITLIGFDWQKNRSKKSYDQKKLILSQKHPKNTVFSKLLLPLRHRKTRGNFSSSFYPITHPMQKTACQTIHGNIEGMKKPGKKKKEKSPTF